VVKKQTKQPEKEVRPEKRTKDTYDVWINKRVHKKAQETAAEK
jgi:hypothetical protein